MAVVRKLSAFVYGTSGIPFHLFRSVSVRRPVKLTLGPLGPEINDPNGAFRVERPLRPEDSNPTGNRCERNIQKDKDTKDALRPKGLASRRNPQGQILEDGQGVASFEVSYLAQTDDMNLKRLHRICAMFAKLKTIGNLKMTLTPDA